MIAFFIDAAAIMLGLNIPWLLIFVSRNATFMAYFVLTGFV